MLCNTCDGEIQDGAETCAECEPKPAINIMAIMMPVLGIVMVLLMITVINRSRQEDTPSEPSVPSQPSQPEIIPNDGLGVQTGQDIDIEEVERVQRELRRPIVLRPATEKSLLSIRRRLYQIADADDAAWLALRRIVERCSTLEGRITADIDRGGPMADVAFRQRWTHLVSPERTGKRPVTQTLDEKLEADIAARRPIERNRIKAMDESADELAKQVVITESEERLVAGFIRSMPAPGQSLLLVGGDNAIQETAKHRDDPEVIKQLFVPSDYSGTPKVNLEKMGGNFNYDRHSVDLIDSLIIIYSGRGITKTAYELSSLRSSDALNDISKAKRTLQAFLDDDHQGEPEAGMFESTNVGGTPDTTPQLSGIDLTSIPSWLDTQGPRAGPAPPPPPVEQPANQGPDLPGLFRKFTDIKGRWCEARLVVVDGGHVIIEDRQGNRRRFLAMNFSPVDFEYLAPYIASHMVRTKGEQKNPAK